MLRQIEEDKLSQSSISELQGEVVKAEQQLEAQKGELEKLQSENQQLNAKIAKNSELFGTTIQILQLAQQRRLSQIKAIQSKENDHGSNASPPTGELKQVS